MGAKTCPVTKEGHGYGVRKQGKGSIWKMHLNMSKHSRGFHQNRSENWVISNEDLGDEEAWDDELEIIWEEKSPTEETMSS